MITLPFQPLPQITTGPLTLFVLAEPDLLDAGFGPAIEGALTSFIQGWPHFWQRIMEQPFLADADISPDKPWEADMVFVTNASCHTLNRDYRQKDMPTDVITFTLYADDPERHRLVGLPIHHLGSVIVNVDWAWTETGITREALQLETEQALRGNLTPTCHFITYILERMIHGCLHLIGVTHDTEIDYTRVVEIQTHVLNTFIQS